MQTGQFNDSNQKNKLSRIYKVSFILAGISFFGLLVHTFCNLIEKINRSELIFLFIASMSIGLISYLLDALDLSELAVGSFKLKLNKKLSQIENAIIASKAIRSKTTEKLYWIDSFGIAHEGEEKAVQFLSIDKRITVIEDDSIIKIGEPLPSWNTAIAISPNDTDVFILFYCKLYYQSNLSSLYDLTHTKIKDGAQIDNLEKEFKEWTIGDERFVKKMTASDPIFKKLVMT